MVLTTVPQTAMTVSAATEDEIATVSTELPDAPEEILDDTSQEDLEEPEEEQGEEEQEETEETETPQTPETPPTENEEEGEESEDVQEEGQAPAEEQQPIGDSSEAETEPVVSEEVSEEDDEEARVADTVINAAVVSEKAVVTQKFENASEDDKSKAEDNAKIHFMGNCVSGDKVVENRDLVFRVEPADGRVLTKVTYKVGDGAESADQKASAKTGITITASSIFKTADNVTTGTPVEITVVTKPVEYTVKLDNSSDSENASNYKLYEVKGTGDGKLASEAVAAAGVKVAYDGSVRFALVPNDGKNLKPDTIELGEETLTFEKKELEQETAAQETPAADPVKKTAYVFTVNPASYDENKHEDATQTVTVSARALNALTVTMTTSAQKYEYKASAKNTAEATYINYNNGFTDVAEESKDLAKSLAFIVHPTDGNVVTDVKATVAAAAPTGRETAEVDVAVADVADSNDKECTIALNQEALDLSDGSLALTVTVETDLDAAAADVTKISFKGAAADDLDRVEYKAAATSADLESAAEGNNDILVKRGDDTSPKYFIQVAPKEGFELRKSTTSDKDNTGTAITEANAGKQIVVIKETRKVGTAAAAPADPYVMEAYAVAEGVGTAKPIELALSGGEGDAAYAVTAVEITVAALPIETTDEKKVTFKGDLLDSVTIINATGVVLIDDADDEKTYAVAEGTGLFEFSIAADKEPMVELGEDVLAGKEAEGSYSYSIPASTLDDDATNNIITITEADVEIGTVTVNAKTNDLSVDDSVYFIGDEEAELKTTGQTTTLVMADDMSDPVIGSEVSMKLVAKPGVLFGDVTYTVGAEEAKAATVSTDKTTAEMKFAVTDDVTVDVETVGQFYVVLKGAEKGEDGVYTADYDAKNIEIELHEGLTKAEAEIYDVAILDGEAAAATTAKVTAGTAKIESIHKDDRGRNLTVRVYKDSKNYYDATLAVSGASTGVTVKMNGVAVTEDGISMMTDSKVELEVSAAGEKANLNDLKAAIVFEKKGETAVSGTPDAFFNLPADGTVAINDGKINLTAKAVKEAPKDSVSLVISSKNEKDETDATKDKVFAKIPVNVGGPLVMTDEIKEVKAVAAASSNRQVRLNLNLDFKDNKKLPAAPLTGDLYYKVELTKVEGDAKIVEAKNYLTLISEANRVRYEKIDSYKAADLAKFVEFNLVESYTDDAGEEIYGDLPGIITVEAKVTLVQSLAAGSLTSASTADAYVANDAKAKEVKEGLVTRAPIYETKLSVKTVNGATVFTGQKKVTVATPVFTKDTTCDEITVEFVNSKTGKILSSSQGSKTTEASYSSNNFKAGVNEDNSIWVSCTYGTTTAKNIKDLGVKVTAHAEDDEYRASAVVKLKVQQGIYAIGVDESKAALPDTLYRDAKKGTVKSVKIATVLNNGYKNDKPAKANLTWEITDGSGKTVGEDGCSLDANMKKALTNTDKKGKLKPAITVKNGTVSVTKDYPYVANNEAANTFYVSVKAADFVGNQTKLTSPVKFVISSDPQVIGSLAVVDEYNEPVGEISSDKNGAVVTVKAETLLDGARMDSSPRIVALKSGAKLQKGGYYNEEDFLPATITVSGKLVTLDKSDNASQPELVFSKPGDKIAVTAKVVDGSASKPVKMTLNVKPIEKLGLYLLATSGEEYDPETESIAYSGSSNEKYELDLCYQSEDEEWYECSSYKNVKIKVDNGKFVANKNWAKDGSDATVGNAVVVAAGKPSAKITLTDSGAKNAVKNTYTINAAVNTGTMKAAKIKMTDPKKVTAGYNGYIWWQATDQDKTTKEYVYAGKYVKLAPDFTVAELDSAKKSKDNVWDAYDILDEDGEYIRIDENGRFSTNFPNKSYAFKAGTYKMIATVGTIENGTFVPETKDTKLSLNVAKAKKVNTNLTVTAAYKLDARSAAAAKIAVKTGASYTVSDAKNVIKKDQLLGDHSNHFTDFFEVKVDNYEYDGGTGEWVWSAGDENTRIYESEGDRATIGLRDDLTADEIKYITGKSDSKEEQKKAKEDCVGYITVDNGTYRKDVKITITFKELNKYTAKADPFFENSQKLSATVSVYDGKNYVPVKYADINTEGKNDLTGLTAKEDSYGNIVLESATGFAAGKYTVSLKVVPMSAATIWASKDATNPLDKAAILKDYAVPAELKLEVKELAKAQKTLKTDLKVVMASYDYARADNNKGYVRGAAGKFGSYVANVPYTLTAGNVNVDSVTLTLAEDINTVEGAEKKLVEAAKGVYERWNDSEGEWEEIPAIKLTVNKEALEKAVKNNKHLHYGKTLNVPVKITYKNAAGATAEETVTYKVTIPKRPADTYDAAALEKKVQKLFVDVDEYYPEDAVYELQRKVSDVIATIVPADTDYYADGVSVTAEEVEEPETPGTTREGEGDTTDPTPGNPNLDIVKTGKAVASFTIKNNVKTDETAKTYKYTYDLGILPNEVGDNNVSLTTLSQEIRTALTNGTVTYAKDKDAAKVMEDLAKDGTLVKKVLDAAKAGRKNYSIKASVKHIPASTESVAKADVTVEIRNLTERETINYGQKKVVYVNGTLSDTGADATLKKFDAAYADVKTWAVEATIKAIVDDCSGQEAPVKSAIEAEAAKKVNNPGITVTVNDWSFKAPETVDGSNKSGEISFTIKLEENRRFRNIKVAKIVLDADNVGKYAPIATVKSDISDAIVGADNAKLKELANPQAGAINTDVELKAAIVTELKKIVDEEQTGTQSRETAGAKYLGYTFKISEWSFTPATSGTDASVTFKVTINSKGSTAAETISVSCTDLIAKDDKYQTVGEVIAELEKLAASTELEVESAVADQNGALTAINDALAKYKKTGSSVTINATVSTGENASVFTAATDTANASLTNVEITVSKSGEEAKKITRSFTFKVVTSEA